MENLQQNVSSTDSGGIILPNMNRYYGNFISYSSMHDFYDYMYGVGKTFKRPKNKKNKKTHTE